MTARRVLAGVRRNGEPLHITDPTATLPAVRPSRERSTEMNAPAPAAPIAPMRDCYGFTAHRTSEDGTQTNLVTVVAPTKVAAAAAREFADLIDPFQETPGLNDYLISRMTWKQWASKVLPFLRNS